MTLTVEEKARLVPRRGARLWYALPRSPPHTGIKGTVPTGSIPKNLSIAHNGDIRVKMGTIDYLKT
jgi:hypothetical protein